MNMVSRNFSLPVGLLAACCSLAVAQSAYAQLGRGFETKVDHSATGEELNVHYDMWVMELDYKPMRMLWVDITDPKTGEKKRELIWYLVYRAVNRDLEKPVDNTDTAPVNTEDAPPDYYFIPEFTLVTNDNTGTEIHNDVILPEAQRAIIQRERLPLKNSVDIVTQLSTAPVPRDDPNENQQALYGVAMWRGVDPATDKFSVFMSGFSNGYQLAVGPDDEQLVGRRTIRQDYWRPGDRFFPNEREIRPDPAHEEPGWLYRPDEFKQPPAAAPANPDA